VRIGHTDTKTSLIGLRPGTRGTINDQMLMTHTDGDQFYAEKIHEMYEQNNNEDINNSSNMHSNSNSN